jgi:hypothetical protein
MKFFIILILTILVITKKGKYKEGIIEEVKIYIENEIINLSFPQNETTVDCPLLFSSPVIQITFKKK